MILDSFRHGPGRSLYHYTLSPFRGCHQDGDLTNQEAAKATIEPRLAPSGTGKGNTSAPCADPYSAILASSGFSTTT